MTSTTDPLQAMRFVWLSLERGSVLMIVWVVTGSLICVRLIEKMAAKARADGSEEGWAWLIFSAILLFLFSNLGGALTWTLTYGRYEPEMIPGLLLAMGALAMFSIPFLIGGQPAWEKMHYYALIWGIYLTWGMTVFFPWLSFCRDPFG